MSIRETQLVNYLQNRETFATSLLAIMIDTFSTDMVDWEPESLEMEIIDTFKIQLPQVNKDKLWALTNCLTTDQFYQNFYLFNFISQALNDEEVDFSTFSPTSLEGAAWAITEVKLNDPESESEFSDEISLYLGALLDFRGMTTIPPILKMARPSGRMSENISRYTEDPEFYAAIQKNQKESSESIMDYVNSRMKELFDELSALPLSTPVDMSTFKLS
jgi:hypothetical protein